MALLDECEAPLIASKDEALTVHQNKMNHYHDAREELDRLMGIKQSLMSLGTSRNGRNRRSALRTIDSDEIESISLRIVEGEAVVEEKKIDWDKAKTNLSECVKKLDTWRNKFPHRTAISLTTYCQDKLKPVVDYYDGLFRKESGDYYIIRKCLRAAQIFNPWFLKANGSNMCLLNSLIDDIP